LLQERDVTITKAFADLREGESLTLLYDYEPRSLLHQLEERFPESFGWSQRHVGPKWEVTLRRISAAQTHDPALRFLERCAFLASASETTKRALSRVATSRPVARNKPVALQGVTWPFLGIVRSGRIFAIVSSPEGREQILYEVHPFDIFGEIMLFDRGDSVARFVALAEPSEVILVPRDDVLRAMASDDGLRAELSASCGRRARALIELLCAQVSKPVLARIALLLTKYAGDPSVPVGGAGSPMTLSQIAAAAGTVKEVVARSLARLEAEGAIQRKRGAIYVIDEEKLRRFA